MEMETVSRAIDLIEGFPPKLKTVVQHLLISHHGRYEFGSPKLPMIREALVFHYLDDLDSKLAAVRAALEQETGEPDRKSTRLNSSHLGISYAVFCLKKKYIAPNS